MYCEIQSDTRKYEERDLHKILTDDKARKMES